MHTWLSFTTGAFAGPVCLAVTVVGLVLSGLAWRRRGLRSGLRGAAWSLLPAAAWLTHSLGLLGRLVSAVVQFGSTFALSPTTWLGVILTAIAALFFLVSGGIPLTGAKRRRRKRVRAQQEGQDGAATAGLPGRQPAAVAGPRRTAQPADTGLDSDVQAILRKHNIS